MVFPLPLSLGWPVTSLTNSVWGWLYDSSEPGLGGLAPSAQLLRGLSCHLISLTAPTQRPHGKSLRLQRGRGGLLSPKSSSPPARCQACEISTDTPDQSNHLLNTTRWPQSSPQGTRELPRGAFISDSQHHKIYKIVVLGHYSLGQFVTKLDIQEWYLSIFALVVTWTESQLDLSNGRLLNQWTIPPENIHHSTSTQRHYLLKKSSNHAFLS